MTSIILIGLFITVMTSLGIWLIKMTPQKAERILTLDRRAGHFFYKKAPTHAEGIKLASGFYKFLGYTMLGVSLIVSFIIVALYCFSHGVVY